MNKTQPSTEHKRHDLGVVIRWEMHMFCNVFVVEQFRGYMQCSSCARRSCEHAKLAEQLEQNYRSNNQKQKPGSCIFCGRMAPVRNGLAICSRCAS